MNQIVTKFVSAWSRVGLGIVAMSAWSLFFWNPQEWVFDLSLLLAAIGASGLWIFSEYGASTAAHPADLKLYEKFQKHLPDKDREFLREHNFRISYNRQRMEAFEEIAFTWKGADYEFHDARLKREFEEVQAAFKKLVVLLMEFTYAEDNNLSYSTPLHDLDKGGSGVRKETRDRIKEMNDTASAAVRKLDHFVRSCQKRLKAS